MWEDEYPIWEQFYPTEGIVLDVGADIESVQWFKQHGARVIPIGDEFGTHIDAIKIDVEGAERGMIIETHFPKPRLELLHTWPNKVQLWRLTGGKGLYR